MAVLLNLRKLECLNLIQMSGLVWSALFFILSGPVHAMENVYSPTYQVANSMPLGPIELERNGGMVTENFSLNLSEDPASPYSSGNTFWNGMKEFVGEDRLFLTIGYKLWVAKWETPVPFQGFVNAETNSSSTTDFEAYQGPTITVMAKIRDSPWFNLVFANFTWLNAGANFSSQINSVNNPPNCCLIGTFGTAIRTDLSYSTGIAIYKGLGVFAGYYHTKQRFSTPTTISPLDGSVFLPGATIERIRIYEGPLVGVFGAVPASDHLTLFGNFSFAFLKLKDDSLPGGEEKGVQGYATEVGMQIKGPSVWKIDSSVQLGFRAQMITVNFGDSGISGSTPAIPGTNVEKYNDITWGPTLVVNLQF